MLDAHLPFHAAEDSPQEKQEVFPTRFVHFEKGVLLCQKESGIVKVAFEGKKWTQVVAGHVLIWCGEPYSAAFLRPKKRLHGRTTVTATLPCITAKSCGYLDRRLEVDCKCYD